MASCRMEIDELRERVMRLTDLTSAGGASAMILGIVDELTVMLARALERIEFLERTMNDAAVEQFWDLKGRSDA